MTSGSPRARDHHFWTIPRAAAFLLVLAAAGGFVFVFLPPPASSIYSHAQVRAAALAEAGFVYAGRTNGSPIPVARTVADMRKAFSGSAYHVDVHVVAHGADVKVTFPKNPAVCVSVPAIDSSAEPRIVPC